MKIPSYQDIRKTPQPQHAYPTETNSNHIPPNNTKQVEWIEQLCQPKLLGNQKLKNERRQNERQSHGFRRQIKSSLQYRKALKRKSVTSSKKRSEEEMFVSKKIEQTYNRITTNSSPKNVKKIRTVIQRNQEKELSSLYGGKKMKAVTNKVDYQTQTEHIPHNYNTNIFSKKISPLKKSSRYQPETNLDPYIQGSTKKDVKLRQSPSPIRSGVESPLYL